MIGAAMQAPLAALALVLEITGSGFGLMVPMMAATVTATAAAFGLQVKDSEGERSCGERNPIHRDADLFHSDRAG
jgi:H+/Cl- antiporter ClcA